MGLKQWILPYYHFKTHLFFHFLVGGTLVSLDPGVKGGLNCVHMFILCILVCVCCMIIML